MTRGPAETDAWAALEREAERSGEFLDVPDYLERSRQLSIAFELLNDAYRESRRSGPDAAADRRLTRRYRFASATRRLREGDVSLTSYFRTCLWIVFKSHRVESDVPPSKAAAAAASKVRRLIRSGRLDEAYVLARALADGRRDARAMELVIMAQSHRGAISAVLAACRRLGDLRKDESDGKPRRLEAWIRSLSGWYPRLAGDPTPVEPVDSNAVLHLADVSLPQIRNAFTERLHYTARAEQAAGLHAIVATGPRHPGGGVAADAVTSEPVDQIEYHRLDLGAMQIDEEPVDEWLERFALLAYRKVREVRPAIIHVSGSVRGYETALVGLSLQEKTGLPLVYEVHSMTEGSWADELAWEQRGESLLRRRAVEIMCMERADMVITGTVAMRDEIIRAGVAPERVAVVPMGIDPDAVGDHPDTRSLRRRFGLGERPTFGTVTIGPESGALHDHDAHQILIETTALLKERGSAMSCVLVGSARRESLELLAEERGVSDRVVFVDPSDTATRKACYGLVDVFVVPSDNPRVGRTAPPELLEAMAAGRPVVVSDLPGLREVADPPHRGLDYNPGDADSLADVIEAYERVPEPLDECAERGQEWVTRERRWERNGARYKAVYEAAVAHRATHAR